MSQFSQDIAVEEKPKVHSFSEEEFERIKTRYQELKVKVESEGYELTIEDQKDIVLWMRINREVAFVLNSKPEKPKKEPKAPKEPKVKKVRGIDPETGLEVEKEVKVRKRRKVSKKVFDLILLKEMKGLPLTDEEEEDKQRYVGAIE